MTLGRGERSVTTVAYEQGPVLTSVSLTPSPCQILLRDELWASPESQASFRECESSWTLHPRVINQMPSLDPRREGSWSIAKVKAARQ